MKKMKKAKKTVLPPRIQKMDAEKKPMQQKPKTQGKRKGKKGGK